MEDTSIRSRRGKPPPCRNTPILLSAIKYNSTCITLELPFSIACGECNQRLNPLENTRKKRKTERQKLERRRCQQYWCSKYVLGANSTEGNAVMHRKVRSYLRIEQDIVLNLDCPYSKNTSSLFSQDLDTNEISSVPVIYNMSNNSTAFNEEQIPLSVKQSKTIDPVDSETINDKQSAQEKIDSFLESEFPRNYMLSRGGRWYFDGNHISSDRRIHDLSLIVYDFVRVLSKSHSTTVSNLLATVKKRVDYEVSRSKPDNEGTVELVDQYKDKGTQTDIDHCTLHDDLNTSVDNDLNATIVTNIKAFLTPARKGPISSVTSATKNTITSACTYSYTHNQDRIRKAIGVSKHYFYSK